MVMSSEKTVREGVNAEEVGIRLLRLLDADPVRAERELERITAMLVRYFASRRCPDPENLVGETMVRVYRSIVDDKVITCKLQTYMFSVATNVAREDFRARQREERLSTGYSLLQETVVDSPDQTLALEVWEQDLYLQCLHRCLEQLEPDERQLVQSFYSGGNKEGDQKRHRQALAEELRISVAVLRGRALRLRRRLSDHIRECVEKRSAE